MNLCIRAKLKNAFYLLAITIAFIFAFNTNIFAENIALTYNYGIKNVAKDISNLPIRLYVENKDTQTFKGLLTINVYENNDSVFTYSIDLNIPEKSMSYFDRNITISSSTNTIIINILNKREEIVTSERTNIDLSYYSDKFLIGAITNDYSSLLYLDDIIIENTNIQTKLVEMSVDAIVDNNRLIDVVDAILISDINASIDLNNISQPLYSFISTGKPIFVCIDDLKKINSLPNFIKNYATLRQDVPLNYILTGSSGIESREFGANIARVENGILVLTNFSLGQIKNYSDIGKRVIDLFVRCIDKNYLTRLSNAYNSQINNDYYNISNLLNMIDKYKLPDIFILTVMLIFYISFLTIILYVFLRNINKRKLYIKCAIIFSIIYTIFMFSVGYSVMKKNTFLTYLSIVGINESNAKEKAFLNFRTSESGDYSFNLDKDIALIPILRNNAEPIKSFNFMSKDTIKSTIFTEDNEKTNVSVENAKDFDSNVFYYNNSNYLNDVYNIEASFKRYNGEVIGRITNNMNVDLKNASLLLYGKVLKIGDIAANHSISLSRANSVNSPINNNIMLAEILTGDINKNVVKYYLDENVLGYYDHALLLGFIDDNMTIELVSNDIGDVYGRTLIVTKINSNNYMQVNETNDYCSLKNYVNTIEGYYNQDANTIEGNEEVINEYIFDPNIAIDGLYLENMDSYDYGQIEFNVPFYGEVSIFNHAINDYDILQNSIIDNSNIKNYISVNNTVILKFNPTNRDPLYRKISLPILRAISVNK